MRERERERGERAPLSGKDETARAFRREEMKEFAVRTPDGVTLRCYDFNTNGVHDSVLLLHCNGINCLSYRALIDHLTRCDARVVTYDQRGHGKSRFHDDATARVDDVDLSWKTFARDAELVLESVIEKDRKEGCDANGTKKWHAVGHSLGGFASLWLEATKPGTFQSILAYEPIFALERSTYPQMRAYAEPDGSLQANARKRKRTFKSFEEAFKSYRKGILGKVMDERSLRGYVYDGGFKKDSGGVVLTCDPEIEARIYENGEEDLNALKFIEERIDTSNCPVTIAIGGATKNTYAYGVGKVVAERIKGARTLEFGLLGHFGPLSAPEAFGSAVEQKLLGIYHKYTDEGSCYGIERSRL